MERNCTKIILIDLVVHSENDSDDSSTSSIHTLLQYLQKTQHAKSQQMLLRWNYFAKLQQRWICQQLLLKQDQQPEWVQHTEEMINEFFQTHLDLAPFPYSDDEAIMMHLLYTCDGYFLKYASRRLRDKFSVVSAAVSQNGRALRFASLRLKKAVNHCSRAIEFAFHDLKLEFEHEKFNKKLIQAGLDGYQQVFRELWPIRDERKTDPCFDSNNNERNTSTNEWTNDNNDKDTSNKSLRKSKKNNSSTTSIPTTISNTKKKKKTIQFSYKTKQQLLY